MGITAGAQRSENVAHLVASDLMASPPAVVRETQTVYEAAALMLQKGVGAVPVVDASGAAVGMVSDGDLCGRAPDARRGTWWLELLAAGAGSGDAYRPQGDVLIRKIMSAPLISASPKAPIQEIAETLRVHRLKRLPVIREGTVLGIISRSDLLSVVERIPRMRPPKESDGADALSFLESLIGGASLSGRLERRAVAALQADNQTQPTQHVFSAEAFRENVRAYRSQGSESKDLARREAELDRRRQIKALLDQHMSEQLWSEMLNHAELAARGGEREFLLLRFPSDLCSDGGRMIDVAEHGWEETLRGEAAAVSDRWRKELKPQGFGLSARIVSFDDGIMGDIGLYLTWKE